MEEKAIKVLDDGWAYLWSDLKKFKKEVRIQECPKDGKMTWKMAQKTPKNTNCAENQKDVKKKE
jgi:hypothetical protein